MRVLKWLIHPLTLAATLIALALYLGLGLLPEGGSGEDSADPLEKAAGAIDPSQSSGTLPPVVQTQPTKSAAEIAQGQPGEGPAGVTGNAMPQPPGQPTPLMQGQPIGGAEGQIPASGEALPGMLQLPAEEDTEAPALPGVTLEEVLHTWRQARLAAWQGDYASAIEYYQTVVTLQPDNYDAYGEMGNVLLYSGDRHGAAEAYYQAARLLSKTPYHYAAWNLLRLIAGLDRDKAEKLFQQLLDQRRRQ